MKHVAVFVLLLVGILGALYYFKAPNVGPAPVEPTQPAQPMQQQKTQPVPDVIDPLKPTFQQAAAANKQVFLFLTIDNCIFCERMKREVFPKTDFKSYVFLETKDQTIHNKYLAQAFPTFIVLDNTGKELKRHTGYLNLTEFKQWLH